MEVMPWKKFESTPKPSDFPNPNTEESLQDIRKKAWNSALKKIAKRERSSQDVRKHLESKSFDATIIDSVLQELVEKKWLDDHRFSQVLVRYQGMRGKGPSYIQRKLREKGLFLRPDEIQKIIEDAQGKNEVSRAREIIERKYPEYLTDLKEKKKAFEALVRRGFSFDTAKKAISKVNED